MLSLNVVTVEGLPISSATSSRVWTPVRMEASASTSGTLPRVVMRAAQEAVPQAITSMPRIPKSRSVVRFILLNSPLAGLGSIPHN